MSLSTQSTDTNNQTWNNQNDSQISHNTRRYKQTRPS